MNRPVSLLFAAFMCMAFRVSADKDKPVTMKELPSTAQQFIKKHFPNKSISFAKMEIDHFVKTYEVIFTDGSSVDFDRSGNWTSVDCKFTQVPSGIVPEKIKQYLVMRFKNPRILEIDRNSHSYEVTLDNDLELVFDLKFNFIKIDH